MNHKDTSAKHIFRTCFKLMRSGMPKWLLCIAGVTLVGFFNYGLNLSVGLMMSYTIEAVRSGISPVNTLAGILLMLAVLTIAACIGYILNARGAFSIRVKIQRKLLSAWIRQTEKWAEKQHSGDAMAIASNDMEVVEDFFFQGFLYTFLINTVSGLASAVTLAFINWRLLLAAIMISSLSPALTIIFSKKLQEISRNVRTATSKMTETYEEVIGGNVTHRMMGTVSDAIEAYHKDSEAYTTQTIRENILQINLENASRMLVVISDIAFLLIGLYLSSVGKMEFSSILIAMTLKGPVAQMINSLGATWKLMVSVSTSAERVLGVLGRPGEDMKMEKPDLPEDRNQGALSMENILFSYNEENPVLKKVSFALEKGKSMALVGGSGSGKSTIMKLLLQFYTPDAGDIKIADTSYGDCNLDSWRGQFAYIQQEASLFNKPVRENIAIGAYGAGRTPTEEEIITAAKNAGAHDFIMEMPQGYDTVIEENGGNLSSGQKQRIAIARAFVSDAPIMLLDEPTAALDSESERLVQQSLAKLAKNRTLIIIAHKLETIRSVDRILVMQGGQIVETGTHEQLLAGKGIYKGLYEQNALA